MPKPEIRSIDDYESYLQAALSELRPEQRTAFAAAMAERYLPVYAAFSKAENWGDPKIMRRALDAVWDHLRGQALTGREIERYAGLLRDGTPHMDDFDAEDPLDVAGLAAALMVQEALECCRSKDNLGPAEQAAFSGFEAAMPNWSDDPAEQHRLWQKSAVRKEFTQQTWLLEQVSAARRLDDAAIAALRREVVKKDRAGAIPRRGPAAGPALRTNQSLFEQYRQIIELDMKSNSRGWGSMEQTPELRALMYYSQWTGRYSRRRSIVDGSYGTPADAVGQAALVARNRAKDAAVQGVPDWGSAMNELFEIMLNNPSGLVETSAAGEPHSYGPSLRRLWLEARNSGLAGEAAWARIAAWANHRPAAWEMEDRRKKKGQAYAAPGLGEPLARRVEWANTGNPEIPWAAEVEGRRWQARLNDFPDDYMYSLLIDGAEQGSFHDWPETWLRE